MRKMRGLIIVAAVLVIAGVAASFYLIPDEHEVVQTQTRDVAVVAAGNVDVEAEYNQGRRTFPIVAGLADKRVNEGNRDAAIALLEEYVKTNPNDVNGLKKLAEQYQLAGRQQDFNTQIEKIAALAPTEENLTTLSNIYNADKNYPKQVDVLKKLVEVTNGTKPDYFVDLATIQVVIGDKDGALATIDQLKSKHPTFENYAVTRIKVNILAERGKSDEAFAVAKQWVDRPLPQGDAAQIPPSATPKAVVTAPVLTPAGQKAKELADLANILHYSGHADKAVTLVEPHLMLLQESTELVVAYVNANITLGRDEHAYTILAQIDKAGKMTPELYLPYLQLAIKREDIKAAEDIATRLDTATFNEEQALNIVEVARANNAPSVLDVLLSRFGEPQVIENKPVLDAVIAILKKDREQDKKIDVALGLQLTSVQRVRLAEACARANKTTCFDTIVKQYPPMEQMTTQQIAEFAQLYIIANRPAEIIDGVTAQASKPGAHPDVQDAQRKLAAAAGREDILKPWLEANANTAPVIKLQEYFYLANDRKHYAVSTDIAERMYARDPSPMSRDLMIAAYMGSENYAKALPFLREQVKAGGNDGLYLSALSKQARKDKQARQELTDYALVSLQSSKGDPKQQLNYAYVLLNNGRKQEALPFIKQYAADRGGEWKKMYAQLTTKPTAAGGKPAKKLTREEMLAMASSPTISDANKRQLAFNLVNDGYKADATKLFEQMAQNKSPDSQEVKDLLYMWGGKLNAEQIGWLQQRAASANGYDRQRWADLINTYGDDYAVMQYVSATPDALYNKTLRDRYFRTLATQGGEQHFDANMRGWVAGTTDVPALVDYARTAEAFGYKQAAATTYQRILELDANNEAALNHMTSAALAKGSYSKANQYIDRYIQAQAVKPQPETSPAQAYFYKAELLRRQGNVAGANAAYAEVVRLTPVSMATPTDALSRLYLSEFRLGRHSQAKSGFEQLLAQNPDDKGLLADYMSALIEYKYFEEATRVANQYDKNSPYYGKGAALIGNSAHVAGIEQLSGGRELKIAFSQPIEDASPIQLDRTQQLAWLEKSTPSYDSLTISAKPGYIIRYTPTSGERFAVIATPMAYSTPDVAADRMQDLRLQLLYAQIEQQTGNARQARERMAVLQKHYPNEPQVLTARASIESAQGNSFKATELLRQAQAIQPENEDITLQMKSLRRAQSSDYAKLDHEFRGVGDNQEQITTLSGIAHITDRTEIGINLKNNFMQTDQILNPANGVIGDYDTSRQQGELFIGQYYDEGDRSQFSLFANNDTLGAGGYYAFNNPIGRTQVMAEYQKPYWDFVEAVFGHATRDRVGLTHNATLSPTLSMGIETSVNNYSIAVQDDVAQSGLFRLSLLQRLNEKGPYLALGYGFDGEYLMGKADFDTATQTYRPFPMRSREVHFLSGIIGGNITDSTRGLLVGGYAFDRLNEGGPVFEGRLTQDITDSTEAGVRARYGFESNDTGNSQTNVGGYVMHKF